MTTPIPRREYRYSESPKESYDTIRDAECMLCGNDYYSHCAEGSDSGKPGLYCRTYDVSLPHPKFKIIKPELWRPFILNALLEYDKHNGYPCNGATLREALGNPSDMVCSDYD